MDESSWSSPNPLPCQHPLEDGGPRHVGGSSGLSKELAVEDERMQEISVPESGVHLQTQASPTDSIRKREDRSTDSSEHRMNAQKQSIICQKLSLVTLMIIVKISFNMQYC